MTEYDPRGRKATDSRGIEQKIVTDGGQAPDFDVEGTRALGFCRVFVRLGDTEIIGRGSTPELALRNAADNIEVGQSEPVTDGGVVESTPYPAAIRERPSAGTMAIAPLQREAREISRQRAFDGPHDVDLADALFSREQHLQQHLEMRLDISYPECEVCGSTSSWGQESGEGMRCYLCDTSPSGEVRDEVHRQWERMLGEDKEIVTDGGEPQGAIDNSFDDSERDAREQLAESAADHLREIQQDDIAIDLVTRQPLYVISVAAPTLDEYYEQEGFDLLNYKSHPYLPVQMDDRVLTCVFVPRKLDGIHNIGKTYDYPEGRLARVPIESGLEDSA